MEESWPTAEGSHILTIVRQNRMRRHSFLLTLVFSVAAALGIVLFLQHRAALQVSLAPSSLLAQAGGGTPVKDEDEAEDGFDFSGNVATGCAVNGQTTGQYFTQMANTSISVEVYQWTMADLLEIIRTGAKFWDYGEQHKITFNGGANPPTTAVPRGALLYFKTQGTVHFDCNAGAPD